MVYIRYQDQQATASESQTLTHELEVYRYSPPRVPPPHTVEAPDELNNHAHIT